MKYTNVGLWVILLTLYCAAYNRTTASPEADAFLFSRDTFAQKGEVVTLDEFTVSAPWDGQVTFTPMEVKVIKPETKLSRFSFSGEAKPLFAEPEDNFRMYSREAAIEKQDGIKFASNFVAYIKSGLNYKLSSDDSVKLNFKTMGHGVKVSIKWVY